MTLSGHFPVLETSGLTLLEIQQNHLSDLFRLFSDPQVTKFYNLKTLKEEQESKVLLDRFRDRFNHGLGIRWGIALKGKSEIIGTIGFNNYAINHRANIGYDLMPAYWSKGIMTEALQAVTDFGFRNLQINRIEAEVMDGNSASEKLLQKCGFTRDALLRDWMYWDERHFDMVLYSKLRKEN